MSMYDTLLKTGNVIQLLRADQLPKLQNFNSRKGHKPSTTYRSQSEAKLMPKFFLHVLAF